MQLGGRRHAHYHRALIFLSDALSEHSFKIQLRSPDRSRVRRAAPIFGDNTHFMTLNQMPVAVRAARCAVTAALNVKSFIFLIFTARKKKSNENWIAGRPSGADVARRPRRTRFDAI